MKTDMIINNKDPDHIWVSCITRVPESETHAIQAQINITKSQPILMNPSLYNLAISKFTIGSRDIPMIRFIAGEFRVSLRHVASGDIYTQTVTHIPTSSTNTDFIYTIQDILNDLNEAYRLAFVALNAAHGGVITTPPLIIYNSLDDTISFLVPYNYINTATEAYIVEIWVNTPLANHFGKLWSFFNGYNNANFLDERINVKDKGWNQYSYTSTNPIYSPTTNWFKMDQIGKGSNFVAIAKILITSNSIPVALESVNIDNKFNTGTSSQTEFLNVVTDFNIISDSGTPQNAISYDYVSDIYRLIPLNKTDPFYTLDLKCFLQTKNGTIFPLEIDPGEEFNIKLLFIKKGLPA